MTSSIQSESSSDIFLTYDRNVRKQAAEMAGVTTVAITSCDSAEFRSAPTQMQKIEPTKPGIEFGHYHRIGEQAMPSLLSQTVEMMDDCDGGTTHRVQQLRSLVAGPIEQSQLLSKEDAGRSSLNAGKHSNVSVHRFRNYYFETSRERQMSMNSHPGENAMEEVNSEHVPMEILQEVKLPSECITATHEEQERGRQVPSMEDFSSNTNDQTHMEVAKEVESSFKYTAAGHWEQGSKSVYYKDVAVISTTAGISCCEIGIPRVQPVFKQSTNEVTFVEAMLSHASECKNSLCLFPECHKMKAEIAHCLQHDLLRNYKKCDRCTSVGSVSIYHYRTCFVPSCSFFFCNILKARLNKQRTDDDLVCPHNIVYKDLCGIYASPFFACYLKHTSVYLRENGHICVIETVLLAGRRESADNTSRLTDKDSIITFRIESFIENVHYSVITAKVVGHGQNGNVCEVELLQSIYENHARHIMQEQKICMKKCKYRAEEIEIVAAVRGHSNIIKTLLIVQSNDQMLVFMPKVKCSLLEWKNRLDNEKKNPSVLDVFDVANDVTHGLTFIHSHGIVHRDIKGANILLEMQHSQCNFKICDLGHAKYIGLNGLAPPCPNCGTIGFRAPEIVKREAHGFKVDVYALGVTLFNLALPFNRKQQSQRGITNCCMLQHLPFATNIIEKCCQDDVRRRPSALQLMELVSGPGQL